MIVRRKSAIFYATASAKSVTLVLGIAAWWMLEAFSSQGADAALWPVVLWYLTIGGIVGVLNIYEYERVLNIRIAWWFRAPFSALWMNLMLIAMAPNAVEHYAVTANLLGSGSAVGWFLTEGAVVGVVCGFVSQRVASHLLR